VKVERMTTLSSTSSVRPIEERDVDQASRIVFEAFAGIHDRHRFPRDFPSVEVARGLVEAFSAHPSIHGVVAEVDGRVAGSNFLDARGAIAGIGPITVDPGVQASGVGRQLMHAVVDLAGEARGVRLLQDSFNTTSMGLYTSIGFDTREPVALLAGDVCAPVRPGVEVRPMQREDVAAVEELAYAVLGFQRTNEVLDALAAPHMSPTVALRDGRVTAYSTTLDIFPVAHAVGSSDEDLLALVAGQRTPLSFLLPTRRSELLRAFLACGLRIVKPMTYMTMGEWTEPRGAWVPSVLY
jgi:predicted N-acetyltransferase YhbS